MEDHRGPSAGRRVQKTIAIFFSPRSPWRGRPSPAKRGGDGPG